MATISSSPTIAVIDDTPENLRLLNNILKKNGFPVRLFRDGKSALGAFQEEQPAIILLDIHMPEMNGFEVCENLKKDPDLCNIPIMFISASNEVEDITRGFDLGAVDYITKPFRHEEVLVRVKNHLEKQSLQESLKASYREVVGLEELRDNLIHMIVHDIRSPLAGVKGYVELAARNLAREKPIEPRFFENMLSGILRIEEMLMNILQIKKLEENQLMLQKEAAQLSPIIQEVVDNYSKIYPSIHLVTDLIKEDPPLQIDSDLIYRVIENLISNACKFSPKEGEVRVALKVEEKVLSLSIKDQGKGIPLEAQSRLFEKFGQFKNKAEGKTNSIGLGLAFCKLATEAHGGNISVISALGEGALFTVELPLK